MTKRIENIINMTGMVEDLGETHDRQIISYLIQFIRENNKGTSRQSYADPFVKAVLSASDNDSTKQWIKSSYKIS